jgi:beta-N-acetylhexosaminidase
VNYIFSPSLDLNNNPQNPIINVRSLGEDPDQVGMLGDAYIQGVQDGVAIPCAKHFPGHGNTSEDSHIKLCRIDQSREDLMTTELAPFQRVIDRTHIESIMTAHISVPSIEKDVSIPATLSYSVLSELLRQEMLFEGVIITDAMLMGGITTLYSPAEAAVRSIQAGADIILMPPDLDAAYNGVLQAVEKKEISVDRLKESVKRIIALKAAYSILDPVFEVGATIPKPLIRKADEISFNMSCDAITLVKNENFCLPISPMDVPGIIYLQDKRSAEQMGNEYLQDQVIIVPPEPNKETIEKVELTIQECDVIILMADIQVLPDKDSIHVPPAHESLIHQVTKLDVPVILVSFGNPYLLNTFPDVDGYICAYRVTEQMFDAVMEMIYGERVPHGRLPVSISEEYPVGFGLAL